MIRSVRNLFLGKLRILPLGEGKAAVAVAEAVLAVKVGLGRDGQTHGLGPGLQEVPVRSLEIFFKHLNIFAQNMNQCTHSLSQLWSEN